MISLLLTLLLSVTAPAVPDYGENEIQKFVRCFYRADSACVETWLNKYRDRVQFHEILVRMWAGAVHMKGQLCEVELDSGAGWVSVSVHGVREGHGFIGGFLFVIEKGKIIRIMFGESNNTSACKKRT